MAFNISPQILMFLLGMVCNERNELGFNLGRLSDLEDRLVGVIEPFTPYVVVSHAEQSTQLVEGNPLICSQQVPSVG